MAPRDKGKGRASTSSAKSPLTPADSSPLLILQAGIRSFLIAIPQTYAEALEEARRLLPSLQSKEIFLDYELDGFGWVGLTESAWHTVTARSGADGSTPLVLRARQKGDPHEVEERQSRKRAKLEFVSEGGSIYSRAYGLFNGEIPYGHGKYIYILHVECSGDLLPGDLHLLVDARTEIRSILELVAQKKLLTMDELRLMYEGDALRPFGSIYECCGHISENGSIKMWAALQAGCG